MAKIRLGFDIGSNSLKIAILRGDQFRVEEIRLPENLVDEGGVILPHAFTEYLRQLKRSYPCPRGRPPWPCPPARPSAAW